MKEKKGCKTSYEQITSHQFVEAERLVIAGIIARLIERFRDDFKKESALFASSVVSVIFDIPLKTDKEKTFLLRHKSTIDFFIEELSADEEICIILTQTFVMRIVYASRIGGCKTEDMFGSVERLKKLGLYFETRKPPTPSAFVHNAKSFFLMSPKS